MSQIIGFIEDRGGELSYVFTYVLSNNTKYF